MKPTIDIIPEFERIGGIMCWQANFNPDTLPDIRAYALDGVWFHPCGREYVEGGPGARGGGKNNKEIGNEFCPCDLCWYFSKRPSALIPWCEIDIEPNPTQPEAEK